MSFINFWLNVSDEDAEKYIKIFTLLSKEVIDSLIAEHKKESHLRLLQKELSKDITCRVHSKEAYNAAIEASQNIIWKRNYRDVEEYG